MRAAVALLAALVLLVAAFAALVPATLVDARVAALTRDRVRLAQASGTVWSGEGQLCEAAGRWCIPVAWTLQPAALLRGALDVTLVPRADAPTRGGVVAQDGTLALRDVHLEVPAAAIESAWKRSPVPQFEGNLVLDAPAFRSDGARSDGALDLRWQRARAGLAGTAMDLGTVEAHARGTEGGVTVDLGNHGGDVAITGVFRITPQAYALDATLTPATTLAPALALLVRSLGTPAPDGSVHVTWQGPR
jgi:hypothetical protein